MFSVTINILYIVLMIIIVRVQSLVKLTILEDNSLKLAETAIRSTVYELFTSFKIQEVKRKPRLKQLLKMHDYFVSIMLKDCNNLEKIIGLSRINDIENNTQNLITIVNEALNESYKSSDINGNNTFVGKYIDKFIRKLKYLNKKYATKERTAIIKKNTTLTDHYHYHYPKNETLTRKVDHNSTETKGEIELEEENVSNYSDFWKPSGRRIYGGSRTRIQNYPFMASIMFFKKFQCAGSIIKNDMVISSASCLQLAWNNRFFRENPAFLSVQVGSNYYDYGGEHLAVQEVYFHPSYDPTSLSNNLVIMRLTRQIVFRKKHNRVKRIDIDRSPTTMPITSRITIIGWGARDDSNIIYNAYKNKLSYAELDFYPLQECQEHYTREFVSMRNFCAGFFSKGGGACNRDAGGPAVVHDTLMGIISFGSPICGAPDSPTVFTKVGFYADWIDGIMNQEVPVHSKTTTKRPYSMKYNLILPTTRRRMRITPMGTTKEPVPIDLADLRILQENNFKDSEEVKEHSGQNASESIEHQNLKISKKLIGKYASALSTQVFNKLNQQLHIQDKTDDIPIETKQPILQISKKQNRVTVDIPTTEDINILSEQQLNEDETDNMSIEIEPQALEMSKKQNSVTTNILTSETINKPYRQLNEVGNDTISKENNKELIQEEKILEKPKNNLSLKDNIMQLIDNLDLDKFLDEMENNLKEEIPVVKSNESKDVFNPEEKSIVKLVITTTDEDDLSISGDSFEDLTLRSGRTGNLLDTVPESTLFEIISSAIEEELKQKQETEKLINVEQRRYVK